LTHIRIRYPSIYT